MRLSSFISIAAVAAAAVSATAFHLEAAGPQAQPRQQTEQRRTGDAGQQQEGNRRDPQREAEPRQAQPRAPTAAPQREAVPRRPAPPPPRVNPPRRSDGARIYVFPPVSLHRGYYYHPYFGFYYGPWYGPFYPPGAVVTLRPTATSAVRTRIKPVDTQVYVNGYYAGVVDDFDGVFQRLHLPAGEHELEFYLEGYRSFRPRLYLNPGEMREIEHQMQPLGPNEAASYPQGPRALPRSPAPDSRPSDRPVSPFGILGIQVEPAGAQILVDGETWIDTEEQSELVIHLAEGWHQLEVRREGYQPFRTSIELSEGGMTRLHVRLTR